MVTYRVWADSKKGGDDYYYKTTSKKAAGKKVLELVRKKRLNSVVRNTRKGERYLSKAAVRDLVRTHLGKDKLNKLRAKYKRK